MESVVSTLLALGLALPSAVRAEDAPSPWHVDLDVSYGRDEVGFVGAPIPDSVCGGTPCAPEGTIARSLRIGVGLGHAGFTLEGSLSGRIGSADGGHAVLSAGIRADTGWDAPVSLFFRFAYVRRVAGLEGEGGRTGMGLAVRPLVGLALYGEVSADVTSVPHAMNEIGTFLSWSTFVGGGARLSFGH